MKSLYLGPNITLDLVYIPPGSFRKEREGGGGGGSGPLVTVPGFWLGCYPVTQAQWEFIATNFPHPKIPRSPSHFKGDTLPVEMVTRCNTQLFIQRLSYYSSLDFHLPRETQWEYACRAGTISSFWMGESPWETLSDGSEKKLFNFGTKATTPVNTYQPNAFGLYDMHGNVWEWCVSDWGCKESYFKDWEFSTLKGGSFMSNSTMCCSSSYIAFKNGHRAMNTGFRVALPSLKQH